MIRQSQRRIGLRRDAVPLLKKVNGKPHAKSDDEKENDSTPPSPKRQKVESNVPKMTSEFIIPKPLENESETLLRRTSPSASAPQQEISTSSNTDVKDDSDYDREPDSASLGDDDESAADIPSSFPKNSKMDRPSIKPTEQRTIKQHHKHGALDDSRRDNSSFRNVPSMYDEVEEELSRKIGKPRNGKPRAGFGRAAEVQRALKKATETKEKSKARNQFIRPSPLGLPQTTKSSRRNTSPSQDAESQHSEDHMKGAAEFLDEIEQQDCDLSTSAEFIQTRTKRKSDGKLVAGQGDDPSTSAASGFKEIHTLTQAVAKMDPEEIEKERREHEAEEKEKAALIAKLPNVIPCPMQCGAMLPGIMLDKLSMNASIKEQQQFCHNHRVQDAKRECKLKGYPDIDWTSFSQRLEHHEDDIQRFLDKPSKLHYRKAMINRVKSNKTRNLLQQLRRNGLDELGVGYYGPRGHDMMTAYISKSFAERLGDLVWKDTIVSTQGVMAYVQEVLVLELAAMFIREDLNVPDFKAREVMSKSAWVGDMLCPSEDSGKTSTSRFGGEENLH